MGRFIIASGPVILKENKILLTKDNKDDFYKLPGGIVKEGESLEEACLRKAKEELNAKIRIIRPLFPNILYENPQTKEKMTIVLINYLAELENESEIKPAGKVKDFKWLGIDEIKEGRGNASPNVRELIKKEF